MAADILLYDTDLVPVGEDQLQHIEITRTLARRFNHRFGETFKVPRYYIKKEGKRIMSLNDPKSKMSKSDPSDYSRINLLDSPEKIREKIKKAVTDSGKEIKYSDQKPALKNLLNIFSLVTDTSVDKLEKKYQGRGYKEFKEDLAEAIITFLVPFQKNFHQLSDRKVKVILEEGRQKITPLAEEKIIAVKKKMGCWA